MLHRIVRCMGRIFGLLASIVLFLASPGARADDCLQLFVSTLVSPELRAGTLEQARTRELIIPEGPLLTGSIERFSMGGSFNYDISEMFIAKFPYGRATLASALKIFDSAYAELLEIVGVKPSKVFQPARLPVSLSTFEQPDLPGRREKTVRVLDVVEQTRLRTRPIWHEGNIDIVYLHRDMKDGTPHNIQDSFFVPLAHETGHDTFFQLARYTYEYPYLTRYAEKSEVPEPVYFLHAFNEAFADFTAYVISGRAELKAANRCVSRGCTYQQFMRGPTHQSSQAISKIFFDLAEAGTRRNAMRALAEVTRKLGALGLRNQNSIGFPQLRESLIEVDYALFQGAYRAVIERAFVGFPIELPRNELLEVAGRKLKLERSDIVLKKRDLLEGVYSYSSFDPKERVNGNRRFLYPELLNGKVAIGNDGTPYRLSVSVVKPSFVTEGAMVLPEKRGFLLEGFYQAQLRAYDLNVEFPEPQPLMDVVFSRMPVNTTGDSALAIKVMVSEPTAFAKNTGLAEQLLEKLRP